MLCDPARMTCVPGTRRLDTDLGLTGWPVVDPWAPTRVWYINCLFAQLRNRAALGIRARLFDAAGVVTFCTQRDLEVLLGMVQPGQHCAWLGRTYQDRTSGNWAGLCCDIEDLRDDLYERELVWRHTYAAHGYQSLSGSPTIERVLHLDDDSDAEELWVFVKDRDPRSGAQPDLSFDNLMGRWSRAQRATRALSNYGGPGAHR